MIFEFKIYDKHRDVKVNDETGGLIETPHSDTGWRQFNFALCINMVRIDYFHEYVIFHDDDTPERAVKVYFTDGTFVIAAGGYTAFKNKYNNEYLPLITENPEVPSSDQPSIPE